MKTTTTLANYRKHRETFLSRDNNGRRAQNYGIDYETVGDWRGFEIEVAWALDILQDQMRTAFKNEHGYDKCSPEEQNKLDEELEYSLSGVFDEFCKNTDRYMSDDILDCMQFLADNPRIQVRWESISG